jgi:CRISPR/Cas system CSM-associated protein Csm3 (group 7 of RAMP superfamily)
VTGGARDGRLYAVEIVASGSLTLIIEIQGQVSPLVRALLDLAVADLHDGHIGVGGATTRGLGRLRLADSAAAEALTGAARRLAEEIA